VFTVAGEALVDLVGRPPHFTAHAGGSPYNVAVTLARLGEHVSLFARSGRDVFGAMLEEKARASGVSFDRWDIVDEPTTLAVASLDEHGKANYNFYFDSTAALGWDEGVVRRVPTEGVFHLGSIATWRAPSGRVLQALQRRAYEEGTTLVSYDPNIRPALLGDHAEAVARIERLVGLARVVKASADDLAWLYPGRELPEALRHWQALGPAVVVATDGGRGAWAIGDGEPFFVPSRPVPVVDTVGAGDAFMAGLIDALVRSGLVAGGNVPTAERLQRAVERAALVAALTVARAGANPPTAAELAAALD
jgi:fructokinase